MTYTQEERQAPRVTMDARIALAIAEVAYRARCEDVGDVAFEQARSEIYAVNDMPQDEAAWDQLRDEISGECSIKLLRWLGCQISAIEAEELEARSRVAVGGFIRSFGACA